LKDFRPASYSNKQNKQSSQRRKEQTGKPPLVLHNKGPLARDSVFKNRQNTKTKEPRLIGDLRLNICANVNIQPQIAADILHNPAGTETQLSKATKHRTTKDMPTSSATRAAHSRDSAAAADNSYIRIRQRFSSWTDSFQTSARCLDLQMLYYRLDHGMKAWCWLWHRC
jgi:hypothetical protein